MLTHREVAVPFKAQGEADAMPMCCRLDADRIFPFWNRGEDATYFKKLYAKPPGSEFVTFGSCLPSWSRTSTWRATVLFIWLTVAFHA